MGASKSKLVPQLDGVAPIVAADALTIEQSAKESLVAVYKDAAGAAVLTHARDSWPIVHPGSSDVAINAASKWGPVKERSTVVFTDAHGGICGILINGESRPIKWKDEVTGRACDGGVIVQDACGYENGDGLGVLCVPTVEATVVSVDTVGTDAIAIGTVTAVSEYRAAAPGAVKVPAGLSAIGIIRPLVSLADSKRRGYKMPLVGGLGLFPIGSDGLVSPTPSLVTDGASVRNGRKERVASCPGGATAFVRRSKMQVAPGADALKVVALMTEWDANRAGFEKDNPNTAGNGAGAGAAG